jgi:periplasmic protein TonB
MKKFILFALVTSNIVVYSQEKTIQPGRTSETKQEEIKYLEPKFDPNESKGNGPTTQSISYEEPMPSYTVKDTNVVYDIVEESAVYPGGALKFVVNNIKYPESVLKDNLQGKCIVKFVVTREGNVTNPKIMKGVADCPECDAEVLRIISSMKGWIPGSIDGKTVNSYYTMPVVFKL